MTHRNLPSVREISLPEETLSKAVMALRSLAEANYNGGILLAYNAPVWGSPKVPDSIGFNYLSFDFEYEGKKEGMIPRPYGLNVAGEASCGHDPLNLMWEKIAKPGREADELVVKVLAWAKNRFGPDGFEQFLGWLERAVAMSKKPDFCGFAFGQINDILQAHAWQSLWGRFVEVFAHNIYQGRFPDLVLLTEEKQKTPHGDVYILGRVFDEDLGHAGAHLRMYAHHGLRIDGVN